MALIKCPDCGTDVSDAAPACPKCGRPIAGLPFSAIPSRPAPQKSEKKRTGTVSITLSSFAVLLIGVAIAVCFVPALQIGQNVEAQCKINGLGSGSCQFTNTGWTPGSQCIAVRLVNKKGGSVSSGPLCSGRVWPNDTVQKDVSMVIGDTCSATDAVWSDVCEMDIKNLTGGAEDAALERGTPTPAAQDPAAVTQPSTVNAALATSPAASDASAPTITSADPFDTNAVMRQLPTSADENAKPIRPQLVFSSEPFSETDQTLRYVIVSYALAGDCHACGVTLGAAVFLKSGTSWNLNSWNANLATVGEYGHSAEKAESFLLGDHPGVILRDSDGHQGETDNYATLIGESYGKLSIVWNGSTALDDTGTLACESSPCAKWSSELKALPTKTNGWADLQLQTTGVGERPDKSFGSLNQTQTLQFDGSKYAVTSTTGLIPSPASSAGSSPSTNVSAAPATQPGSAPVDGSRAALLKVINNPAGPSFDCSTATNVTARAICGNDQLRLLDRQMAILYYSKSNYANDPAARNAQRDWLRTRNETCVADVVCLTDQFNQRIQQLNQLPSSTNGAIPAQPVSQDLARKYAEAISNAVTSRWLRADNLPAEACDVDIVQSPGGEVVSASAAASCPYDDASKRAVENAVLRSSPLPYAGYESVFRTHLTFTFRPSM